MESNWSWGAFFLGPLFFFLNGLFVEGLVITAVVVVASIITGGLAIILVGPAAWIFCGANFYKFSRKQQLNSGEVVAGVTKKCPYCAEVVKAEAKLCRFCQKEFTPSGGAPVA